MTLERFFENMVIDEMKKLINHHIFVQNYQ